MEQQPNEQRASPEMTDDVTVITPRSQCRSFTPSAELKRVFRTLPRKKNSPRLPDGQTLPGKPISRPYMPFCPSARIGIWCGKCAGY
jgi:hypothetical protein